MMACIVKHVTVLNSMYVLYSTNSSSLRYTYILHLVYGKRNSIRYWPLQTKKNLTEILGPFATQCWRKDVGLLAACV